MHRNVFDRLSLYFFSLFLITSPASVSASQISFSLSLFFFLVVWLASKKKRLIFRKSPVGWVLGFALGIYFFIFLSTLVHSLWNFPENPSQTSLWVDLTKGEFSDFWMALGIPLGSFHFQNPKKQRILLVSFWIGLGICILSGWASVFTPYRLAKLIQNGFQYPEGERLQHFAGSLFSLPTYLPIGLQATHLTYGGILGLYTVGGIAFAISSYQKIFRSWVYGFLFFIFIFSSGFLLLYNQSRSIWLGIVFLCFQIGTGFLFLEKIQPSRLLRYFFFLGILLGLGLYAGKKIYEKNWLFQRALEDLTQKISTENQRYFIYKYSFLLSKDYTILGIGSNQFQNQWWKKAEEDIEEKEWLWYELSITPKSHAHKDLLHFWVVGGIFSAVCYLLFWIFLYSVFYFYLFEKSLPSSSHLWTLGMGALLLYPAGFFQCFLLDDEVALPFYALVGGFLSNRKKHRLESIPQKTSFCYLPKKYFLYGSLPTIFLFILDFGFWIYRTSIPVEENYVHKIHESYLDPNTLVYSIEGCLSHRFQKGKQIYPPRKEDYQVHLTFVKREQRKEFYPYKIQVELWDRDTFDQDQMYKAHERKKLDEKTFFPKDQWPKTLTVTFPEEIQEESLGFPGKVRFRDFRILFYYHEGIPKKYQPTIEIPRLCGLE